MTTMVKNRNRLPIAIPGPEPTPILGAFGNLVSWGSNPIQRLTELFDKYGTLVALSRGGGTRLMTPWREAPGTLFAYGPDLNRQVLTQHDTFHKSAISGQLYPIGDVSPRKEPLKRWGTGLFDVNGDQHRQHRRLLMPAFHKKRIESYHASMVGLTQKTLDQWDPGQERNIHQDMMQLTLQIATETLFGDGLGQATERVLNVFHESLQLVTAPPVIIAQWDIAGLPYHRLLNLVTQFDTDMRQIIERKRAAGASGDDMLSMLIQSHDEDGTALTEDELIGHVGVIFAAGHETSSNALTWTLFLLSQHPKIAADLIDELQGKLRGSAPSLEQINDLPLLDRVVKESLRILPPVPFNHRIVASATELNGHAIPSGTELLVSIYHTHHMRDLFPEPERFNPDRWLAIEPSTFEYNPFSAGPRMCIGAAFAMMEIKIVLAMLLQQYRLEFVSGRPVDPSVGITMGPRQGMPMRVYAQDRQFGGASNAVTGGIRELVELPQ